MRGMSHALPTSSPRLATSGILLAAVGAVAASGKAVIVKLAYRHGVDATTLLALRMLMAFPWKTRCTQCSTLGVTISV